MAELIERYMPWIYAVFFSLYSLQELMGGVGAAIGIPCLILGIALGAYYVFVVNMKYRLTYFIVAVNMLLLLLTLYAVYFNFFSDAQYFTFSFGTGEVVAPVKKFNTIKSALLSFFPIYVYFWARKENHIDAVWLRTFLFFWIFVAVGIYVHYGIWARENTAVGDAEEITNNAGSEFVALIPYLLLVKLRTWLKLALIMVFAGVAMMSMKRGTIIVTLIFVALALYQIYRTSTMRVRFFLLIAIPVLLSLSSIVVLNFIEGSSFAQGRIEETKEGKTSGRDFLYEYLWKHFLEDTNVVEMLFGSGTDSTILIVGAMAHNDWLEILTCQGLFGVCIFFFYFVALWMDRGVFRDKNVRMVLTMTLIKFVLTSVFSMSYPGFSTSLLLGYCLGQDPDEESTET